MSLTAWEGSPYLAKVTRKTLNCSCFSRGCLHWTNNFRPFGVSINNHKKVIALISGKGYMNTLPQSYRPCKYNDPVFVPLSGIGRDAIAAKC